MKLGIVGSGQIVLELLPVLQEIRNIEVTAICGTLRSLEKLQHLSDVYSISKVYIHYEEFLKDEDVQVVYLGIPNVLHYDYAYKALQSNKHVICEKPFTSNSDQCKELIDIAVERHLFLFEAITLQYLPAYKDIKNHIEELGDIKIVQCHFSKISSRYDAFTKGEILPAFDKEKAGGALYDLNIYNIHFVCGLFGLPEQIHYYPNIERDIDTSGILVVEYPTFKCVCIASKDNDSPMISTIQGTKGYIEVKGPVSLIEDYCINGENNPVEDYKHRMYHEFEAFESMMHDLNYEECFDHLEDTLNVMEILTYARKQAKIYFPGDKECE